MLDARQLLRHLTENGFVVRVVGDRLRVDTQNRESLTPGLVFRIRAAKPELIALIKSDRLTAAKTILVNGKKITVIDTERKPLIEFEQSMRDRFGDRYQGICEF